MKRSALTLAGLALTACSSAPVTRGPVWTDTAPLALPVTERPLTWDEIGALPAPAPGLRIAYGPEPEQFGELRLPDGDGPFPLVILIHGGCWRAAFNLDYFAHWAEWLRARGYASWNVEYRRLGDAGGGWPGTFEDVADAIDYAHELAARYPLNLDAPIAMGHSAGGHLALWAATRGRLGLDAPMWRPHTLPLAQVIGLAPITDLAEYRVGPENSCHAAVEPLLGGDPAQVPERYGMTSPSARLPAGASLGLVVGSVDPIVAPAGVERFAAAARAAGDAVTLHRLPGAGHFDTGVPTPASAFAVQALLESR